MKIYCLLLLSVLIFPSSGNSKNISNCNFFIKEGLRKIQDKVNPGWFATARATFELEKAESIEIARNKAEMQAFMLLTSVYGDNNKSSKRIVGGGITNVCINKNFIYVEVKIDSESIKQAESVKSMSTKSLSDNPTPRSTSEPNKTADSDISELEDIVRGMQRERK